MKNVLTKLASARAHIKTNRIKPDGNNSFSGYDYFTPELVTKLVNDACKATNTICLFSTKRDELGYYGELSFYDLDSSEQLTTIMRTEKPLIKATNETQQCGGMQTYTKRYALMNLFDIEDNKLDFDSQNNAPKAAQRNAAPAGAQAESFTTPPAKDDKPWLDINSKKYDLVVEKLKAKTTTLPQVAQFFKLNKDVRAELQSVVNEAAGSQDTTPPDGDVKILKKLTTGTKQYDLVVERLRNRTTTVAHVKEYFTFSKEMEEVLLTIERTAQMPVEQEPA